MFFPVSDQNDTGYRFKLQSVVNLGLIAACIAVYMHEVELSTQSPELLSAFIDKWSFVPSEYLSAGYAHKSLGGRLAELLGVVADVKNHAAIKFVSAAFLHGGFLHIFSNMLALWMLGDNVEYAMGHIRYLFFFLLTAGLSFMGQTLFLADAGGAGAIGASGAIFAVAGAYLAYFPKARINFFYFFFIIFGMTSFPARLVIAFFFIGEVLTTMSGDFGMVAVWAHVTGFICGFVLSFFFRRSETADYQPPVRKSYSKKIAPWG